MNGGEKPDKSENVRQSNIFFWQIFLKGYDNNLSLIVWRCRIDPAFLPVCGNLDRRYIFFKSTTFLNGYIPLGVRVPLAVLLLIGSGYLAKKGLAIVFGEKIEKPAVIRKSVFGIVRHPIYLGEILFFLGFLMLSLSLAAAAAWVVAIAFLHFIAKYEEKLLLARFGDDYENYLREVPMWLPRLRKRNL